MKRFTDERKEDGIINQYRILIVMIVVGDSEI
jgi:hypothetical protein